MFTFLRNILKGYKRALFFIILIDIIEVGLSLLFVWYSKTIIDIATGSQEGSLWQYGSYLVAIVLLQILIQVIDIRLVNITWTKMSNNVRHRIYSHLIYARWSELLHLHSGDMLNRIMRDSDDVLKILLTGLPMFISSIVQLTGAIALLLSFDSTLAIILGLGVPFLAIFSKLYYAKMRKYSHEIKQSESTITSTIEEGLLNQVVIRAFERQEHNLLLLRNSQETLLEQVNKRTWISIFANIFMRLSFQGGYITAFLWGVYSLAQRTITVGMLTAFLQLVARIQRPVFDLMSLLPNIISAKTAMERLEKITNIEREKINTKIFIPNPIELHIENISFSYAENTPNIFDNFFLVAKPGDVIAIMGETGAGKTTMLRLLLSLVKPTSGKIFIRNGEQNIEVSEETRSNFVYVPQGGSLFSGTIRENLLIGDENATEEQLKEALRIASADFVYRLPDGLNTLIGEKSSGISEGQAQRIAIARSLLRPGKIVLLDEATSALDNDTEKVFLENLTSSVKDKIILFITHHEEVARYCEKVVRI